MTSPPQAPDGQALEPQAPDGQALEPKLLVWPQLLTAPQLLVWPQVLIAPQLLPQLLAKPQECEPQAVPQVAAGAQVLKLLEQASPQADPQLPQAGAP